MKRYSRTYIHYPQSPEEEMELSETGGWVKWEDVEELIKPQIFQCVCTHCQWPHTIEFKGQAEHLIFKEKE